MAILDFLEEVEETETFLKILLYGESGSGKTRLAASASNVTTMSPAVLIDLEAGTTGLKKKNYPALRVISVKKAMARFREDNPKAKAAFPMFEWVMALAAELEEDKDVKTIIFDSFTELNNQLMAAHMHDKVLSTPNTDPDAPTYPDHNRVTNQARKIIRRYRDMIGKHLIITTLERSMASMGEEFPARFGPGLTPKLAAEISGFLDMVLHLDSEVKGDQTERTVQTQLSKKYIAKDRLGVLPGLLKNPTMLSIVKFIGIEEVK